MLQHQHSDHINIEFLQYFRTSYDNVLIETEHLYALPQNICQFPCLQVIDVTMQKNK